MGISVFKCIYHYELSAYGGKPHSSGWRQEYIGAAAGDPSTLGAVLASNGKGAPTGYVIVFDSIANSGAGAYLS